jgi:hypothetical protein
MASAKKTLSDLRARHDRNVVVPNKIKAAIAAMTDEWMYESDFISANRFSPPELAKFRDQFSDFWADLPTTNGKSTARRAWFASKKLADAWKETVGG